MPVAFLMQDNQKKITLANGRTVLLSPSQAQNLKLGQSFASVRQITDSCFAIRNTLFNEIQPKPDWYDGLNCKFNKVKELANEWINDISIAVTATIPSSVISFVPVFDASCEAITSITRNKKGELSANELAVVRQILVRLATQTDEISENVNYYARMDEHNYVKGKLADWEADMSNAGLDLKSGKDNIQNASSALASDIIDFQTSIDSLNREIIEYQTYIGLGAGLVGAGITIGVAGGALCCVFPIIGGIALAIGISTLIGGAVTWGVFQDKINKANRKINEYAQKKNRASATIISLGSLASGVDTAVNAAEIASKNMTDFAASWVTFGNSLKQTIKAIDSGTRDTMAELLNMDLNTAQKNWKNAEDYAKRLLEAPDDVQYVESSSLSA